MIIYLIQQGEIMFSKYPSKSLPSIKWGLFHYIKPFDDRAPVKEIAEIASKYSINLGDNKVIGLNYLFTNGFITYEQADMLAKQLQQCTYFTHDHMDAFIALIQDQEVRQIPIDDVVNTLHLLTMDQARSIANGLTREEAMTNLPSL